MPCAAFLLKFRSRLHGHGHERADENCREKLAHHSLGNGERSRNRRNRSYLAAYCGDGAEAKVSQFGNQLVKIPGAVTKWNEPGRDCSMT